MSVDGRPVRPSFSTIGLSLNRNKSSPSSVSCDTVAQEGTTKRSPRWTSQPLPPTSTRPVPSKTWQTAEPTSRRGAVRVPGAPKDGQNAKAHAKDKLAREDKMIADNPQLKALAVQMRQKLGPFFAAELTFAKTVCQPNPKQLQEMKDLMT